MYTASFAKQKADKFANLAITQEKMRGSASMWLAIEHREDEAYWRGIWWVLKEVEAGTILGQLA